MNFTYNSLINVGSHIGDLKKNYNKQMGFYALGFRNFHYIFNTYKILLNIINILVIFKKILLYKCNFMGFGIKPEMDNKSIFKNMFFNLNQPWVFGKLVGGTISNKNVSLWKDARWMNLHEDYFYKNDLSTDSYFVINNYNTNNILSELLNDFSILIAVNDSNVKIDGLTYILPYNNKSIQSLYFLFKVIEKILIKEIGVIKSVSIHNKNLYYYTLYLKRLLELRVKIHNSKLFINSFKKSQFKRALSYTNILLDSNYNKYHSFLKKAKNYKRKYYKFYKIYMRDRVKSITRDIFFKRSSFSCYRGIVENNFVLDKNLSSLNYKYYIFNKQLAYLRSFRYFSFFVKNKRVYNKILNVSKYKYFFERSLRNKNMLHSSIFYKNPRFTHFYLTKYNIYTSLKNLLYLTKKNFQLKNFLTVYKFFKKHKIFHSYVLPRRWTFYMKYNIRSKKVFKTEDRWFMDYKKHLQKKFQKRIAKRRLKMKKRLQTFDERFNKRFNPNKFTNKKQKYLNEKKNKK